MSHLIDDIADKLASNGRGTVMTDIFSGYLPPNLNGMSVLDTGGMRPDKDIPTKDPTFQVFIRSADYTIGKTLLDNVRSDLHRKANVTYGGTFFYFILAMSEGGHLGRDDSGKELFSINFSCRTR